MVAYLADDQFMQAYYAAAIYGPVLQSQTSFEAFKADPVHVGLLDLAIVTVPEIDSAGDIDIYLGDGLGNFQFGSLVTVPFATCIKSRLVWIR